MSERREVKLKVASAYQRDVGRGIVRIDRKAMRELGVQSGDIVEIIGTKNTAAVVWPAYPEDEGLGIIRMDGTIRKNAGVGLGDEVTVRKADVKEAKKVIVAPTEPIRFGADFVEWLHSRLVGRPVVRGDYIKIGILGQELTFVVTATTPAGIVQITEFTDFQVSEKPVKEVSKATALGVTYEDIGGLKDVIQKVREMIELPLKHPELFEKLGIEPPKGVLLYGPPGTGKTLLAKAVANEANAHFIAINGPEIMSKYYGESEERLREVFKEAEENAPAIIFIDEIDSIAPKREETHGEVEKRVVSQLLTLMDGLKSRGKVIVIGATNRPDAIDPALRRPGRFDREIEVGVPDKQGRKEILQIHTRGMPIEPEFRRDKVIEILEELEKNDTYREAAERAIMKVKKAKDEEEIRRILRETDEKLYEEVRAKLIDALLDELAEVTHGFVGADLAALAREAAMAALRRLINEGKIDFEAEYIPKEVLDELKVTRRDFYEALKMVEPSALREVLLEVPNVRWDDIGGLEDVKQELREAVEWPLKYPEAFMGLGITPPKGILLYGPPGTGKTLLAKAVANESEANFIAIKGPEVLSKWVGESEKNIREIFRKARQAAPTVIFIDEIDAIAPRRGTDVNRVTDRLINQLLTEMDGIQENSGVVVIGATNRPDIIDPALLRPGRFDRLILVPAPDEKARLEIFKVHTRRVPLAGDVDLRELAKKTEGYTGADIAAVVREAAMLAMRRALQEGIIRPGMKADEIRGKVKVTMKDFEEALKKIGPSVSKETMEYYRKIQEQFKQARG
ncbi:CDC48/VCP homolog, AAA superfamily [Thermococcus kodakarensis KOD1]|uniref:CDC48/VCP homolog, AAA superfamily n=1 Tax=Thermococcus kodakarensis (strain ATCC BAA-918 / JCM 12380 / KOD1) TaxID=69014 RepID=Q5JE98_THEKO|nr:CDC48 family AAA ATPase [Thermococcus kodakarensis]WCN29290.1 CDC48 family AAA ATPase [Thermococcus kodakarensis]WCN31587.1 CDC48 family AAA ATPase [Thermococcus kodakarensis]BAD85346.1 CDC48/VCP homolog, AAA superfamily [Thermococcus kodakarensis KOD1]